MMAEGFAAEFFLFLEVLIGGLMSGVMYSLVALGFVLIFKASGVFNFAQGAFVLFAALTFVSLLEMGLGGDSGSGALWFVACLLITLAVMALYGVAVERVVLRPLVNQPLIILFMATIGLNFFTEGFAQLAWGTEVHALDIGIPDEPWEWLLESANMYITIFDMAATGIAGALVLALGLFFRENPHRAGAARGVRRPSGGDVRGHPLAAHMGRHLGGRRRHRADRGGAVGRQARRAFQPRAARAQGAGRCSSSAASIRSPGRWSAG